MAPDGLPYMLISQRCNFLIKNLPMLVYDELKKDDLDTDGPDDEADALRYMLVHLKWIDASVEGAKRGGETGAQLLHNQLAADKEAFDEDDGEEKTKTVL